MRRHIERRFGSSWAIAALALVGSYGASAARSADTQRDVSQWLASGPTALTRTRAPQAAESAHSQENTQEFAQRLLLGVRSHPGPETPSLAPADTQAWVQRLLLGQLGAATHS